MQCDHSTTTYPFETGGATERAFANSCWRMLWIGIVSAYGLGCSPPEAPTATPAPAPTTPVANRDAVTVDDAIVQYSLVSALAVGDYGSGTPLRSLLVSGDFGVGTFDRLDGEMIVLDGTIYQALSDGTIRPANLDDTTPFAAVTYFNDDGRIGNLAAVSLVDLDDQLDRGLPRRNAPYAIRIDGEFAELTLRSVPAQTPPYQPLVDVVKHQVTWQHRNVQGTLVGLRYPKWIGTLNVAGYHWHFISTDRTLGGHVLSCEFQNGLLRFDECTSIVIHVSRSGEFDKFDADDIKKHDIDQVELLRNPPVRP